MNSLKSLVVLISEVIYNSVVVDLHMINKILISVALNQNKKERYGFLEIIITVAFFKLYILIIIVNRNHSQLL